MEIERVEISDALREAEKEQGLKSGTLEKVYQEESRVVYMVRRADIFVTLKKILSDAAKEFGNAKSEDE